MLTNGGNTEGLFRAGWMESGSALPSGDFSKLQPTFDFIAAETGCASARDALECLREVPAERITAAMDKTPTFLSFQVSMLKCTRISLLKSLYPYLGIEHTVDAPYRRRVPER